MLRQLVVKKPQLTFEEVGHLLSGSFSNPSHVHEDVTGIQATCMT